MKESIFTIFVRLLKAEFYKRLQKKTGWGRNEIYREFLESISTCLSTVADQQK